MDRKQITLAFLTLIGAFGGFPTPPKAFTEMTKCAMLQWTLVFVLVFQGGGGQDAWLSASVTAVAYLVHSAMVAGEARVSSEE